jgi:hypothetical protein
MKALFVSILLSISLGGFAQRNYYVLVEAENNQPFYVRVGDNTFSSSEIGHVIISGLSDSAYTFQIGFPKDQFPSSDFMVRIHRKDHGFQLKNLGEKGWVLFDYQSLELIYPLKKQNGSAGSGYSMVKKNDPFASLLSRVVNDTAVLYAIVYDKPIENNSKSDKAVQKDTVAITLKETPKPVAEEPKPVVAVPILAKVNEARSDSGTAVTYVDKQDTVHIFIPAEQAAMKVDSSNAANTYNVSNTEKKETTTAQIPKTETPKTETQLPVIAPVAEVVKVQEAPRPNPQTDSFPKTVQKPVKDSEEKKLVIVNSDCKAIAWDNDVDRLRIKMLGEKDVDNKIAVARKVFKTKCFTAAQIKGLTELFTTDQDKYKFLDAAYPFAVDTDNFKQLAYLLTDDYYVKRFRTMVRLD